MRQTDELLRRSTDAYGNPNPPETILSDQKRFEAEVKAPSNNRRFIHPVWYERITLPRPAAKVKIKCNARAK